MSIAEANYDGIERVYDENYPARGRKGAYVYKIPCGCCGITFCKMDITFFSVITGSYVVNTFLPICIVTPLNKK